MGLAFWRRNTAKTRCSAYLRSDLVVLADHQQQTFEKSVSSIEQWPEALASLCKEAQLGADHQIVFVLGNAHYQQFQVEKPKVADEELAGAVPWTIKDMVAEQVLDLAVDYYEAPAAPMASEKLNVVCVRKPIIQQLVNMANQQDLTIEGITIESLAAINFLEANERCQMLLWQPKGGDLELIVVRQGQVSFTRQLRAFSALGQMQEIEFTQSFFDSLSLELQRSIDYISATLKLPEVSVIQLAIPSRFCDEIARQLQQNLTPKVNLLELSSIESSEYYYHLPALAALQEGVLS
ncbi:MSHA biogenesis protein MshI [Agarivorans sp. Toyoura001]|uniref:MSHA biogenesis protein MshI n=1 Tax=Agarivorans sp. Toyoura001 TaxID=2283141 RepID=UPI0010F334D6|nr:MSHA biogenesis protein MshI [Agarivorans sp. Toyoura001]GDY26467.1 MSHA biogenesis protein MshI [Agarivorans sp. Toyoura001]